VPFNLIPIAALTQSIEGELAWWRIEPKYSGCFFSTVSTSRLWRRSENRAQNVAFDRYASVGTAMHYILVISQPWSNSSWTSICYRHNL